MQTRNEGVYLVLGLPLLAADQAAAGDPAWAPAVDKDGRQRPVDGKGSGRALPDVGAHEHQATPR